MIYTSINSLKRLLRKEKPSKVVLITSPILLEKLKWAVKEISNITKKKLIVETIPSGENAKEWKVVEGLLKKFTKLKLDRKSVVIILGGGSKGDVVGFVCSIYLRGIPYIQIPTTLLAQVDSAIGGKTAINFSGSKNQVGAFYNPIAIAVDKRFLKSLEKEQIINGLAEIIKIGLINDSSIIKNLSKLGTRIYDTPLLLEPIIQRAIKNKESIVLRDTKDKNIRQVLNFGHTLGHAIEIKYNLQHGRAVLIGMVKELKIAEKLGITPHNVREQFQTLLNQLEIVVIEDKYSIDKKSLFHDKKVGGDSIMLPIIDKLGHSKLLNIKLNRLIKLI